MRTVHTLTSKLEALPVPIERNGEDGKREIKKIFFPKRRGTTEQNEHTLRERERRPTQLGLLAKGKREILIRLFQVPMRALSSPTRRSITRWS